MFNQKIFSKTKYVCLVLENCDEILINTNDIVSMSIKGLYSDYHMMSDIYNKKHFMQYQIAKEFNLILKQSANKIHDQFAGAIKETKKYTVFQRLASSHDITQIKLLNNDYNELFFFFVPYKEPKGCENALGAPNILEKTITHKETYWENKNLVEKEVFEIIIKS